ncbi:hypothetical protein BEH94_08225 [Candidatus Altiarchaeales archaeon WOR_SM1_SCG]|nr:hypothetical protein BEH94_08225 [Candidatus Altiarchaeales archaeon WOR_SM1_SCG]
MSEEHSNNKLWNIAVILFACASIFAVVFAVYLIMTTPAKDDSFSEVYFANHANLPEEMLIGNTYNISFTVSASHERKQVNCTYRIYLEEYPKTPELLFHPVENEKNYFLLSGDFMLNLKENKTVQYTFIPEKKHSGDGSKRIVVYVICGGKIYDIFLWCMVKDMYEEEETSDEDTSGELIENETFWDDGEELIENETKEPEEDVDWCSTNAPNKYGAQGVVEFKGKDMCHIRYLLVSVDGTKTYDWYSTKNDEEVYRVINYPDGRVEETKIV